MILGFVIIYAFVAENVVSGDLSGEMKEVLGHTRPTGGRAAFLTAPDGSVCIAPGSLAELDAKGRLHANEWDALSVAQSPVS